MSKKKKKLNEREKEELREIEGVAERIFEKFVENMTELLRDGLEAIVGQLAELNETLCEVQEELNKQTEAYNNMFAGAQEGLAGLSTIFSGGMPSEEPKTQEDQ